MYAKKSIAIGKYADGHTGHGNAAAQGFAAKFFIRLVPKASIDERLQRLRTALHEQRTDAIAVGGRK